MNIILIIYILWIEIELNDKEITIRRCQQNSARKVDTCEDVEMQGMKTTRCYCGTDECNDTNKIRPGSYTTLVAICGVLMWIAKIQHWLKGGCKWTFLISVE